MVAATRAAVSSLRSLHQAAQSRPPSSSSAPCCPGMVAAASSADLLSPAGRSPSDLLRAPLPEDHAYVPLEDAPSPPEPAAGLLVLAPARGLDIWKPACGAIPGGGSASMVAKYSAVAHGDMLQRRALGEAGHGSGVDGSFDGQVANRSKKHPSSTSSPAMSASGMVSRAAAAGTAAEGQGSGGGSNTRRDRGLNVICENFLAYCAARNGSVIALDATAEALHVERRRIYDLVNIFEALGITSRRERNCYNWHGTAQLPIVLERLRQRALADPNVPAPGCGPDPGPAEPLPTVADPVSRSEAVVSMDAAALCNAAVSNSWGGGATSNADGIKHVPADGDAVSVAAVGSSAHSSRRIAGTAPAPHGKRRREPSSSGSDASTGGRSSVRMRASSSLCLRDASGTDNESGLAEAGSQRGTTATATGTEPAAAAAAAAVTAMGGRAGGMDVVGAWGEPRSCTDAEAPTCREEHDAAAGGATALNAHDLEAIPGQRLLQAAQDAAVAAARAAAVFSTGRFPLPHWGSGGAPPRATAGEKSMGKQAQSLIMLFLAGRPVVCLEHAAAMMISEDEARDVKRLKTKVRRLYDIANVLQSLGLVRKLGVPSLPTRKASFGWRGVGAVPLLPGIRPSITEPLSEGGHLCRSAFTASCRSPSSSDAPPTKPTRSRTGAGAGNRRPPRAGTVGLPMQRAVAKYHADPVCSAAEGAAPRRRGGSSKTAQPRKRKGPGDRNARETKRCAVSQATTAGEAGRSHHNDDADDEDEDEDDEDGGVTLESLGLGAAGSSSAAVAATAASAGTAGMSPASLIALSRLPAPSGFTSMNQADLTGLLPQQLRFQHQQHQLVPPTPALPGHIGIASPRRPEGRALAFGRAMAAGGALPPHPVNARQANASRQAPRGGARRRRGSGNDTEDNTSMERAGSRAGDPSGVRGSGSRGRRSRRRRVLGSAAMRSPPLRASRRRPAGSAASASEPSSAEESDSSAAESPDGGRRGRSLRVASGGFGGSRSSRSGAPPPVSGAPVEMLGTPGRHGGQSGPVSGALGLAAPTALPLGGRGGRRRQRAVQSVWADDGVDEAGADATRAALGMPLGLYGSVGIALPSASGARAALAAADADDVPGLLVALESVSALASGSGPDAAAMAAAEDMVELGLPAERLLAARFGRGFALLPDAPLQDTASACRYNDQRVLIRPNDLASTSSVPYVTDAAEQGANPHPRNAGPTASAPRSPHPSAAPLPMSVAAAAAYSLRLSGSQAAVIPVAAPHAESAFSPAQPSLPQLSDLHVLRPPPAPASAITVTPFTKHHGRSEAPRTISSSSSSSRVAATGEGGFNAAMGLAILTPLVRTAGGQQAGSALLNRAGANVDSLGEANGFEADTARLAAAESLSALGASPAHDHGHVTPCAALAPASSARSRRISRLSAFRHSSVSGGLGRRNLFSPSAPAPAPHPAGDPHGSHSSRLGLTPLPRALQALPRPGAWDALSAPRPVAPSTGTGRGRRRPAPSLADASLSAGLQSSAGADAASASPPAPRALVLADLEHNSLPNTASKPTLSRRVSFGAENGGTLAYSGATLARSAAELIADDERDANLAASTATAQLARSIEAVGCFPGTGLAVLGNTAAALSPSDDGSLARATGDSSDIDSLVSDPLATPEPVAPPLESTRQGTTLMRHTHSHRFSLALTLDDPLPRLDWSGDPDGLGSCF